MNALETRAVTRERVLMFAQMTVASSHEQHRVRIRDLSAQGVQAEGDVDVQLGDRVEFDFGAAGKVPGLVAQRDGLVLGLRLEQKIEPDVVRRALCGKNEGGYRPPWYVRGLDRKTDLIGPSRTV